MIEGIINSLLTTAWVLVMTIFGWLICIVIATMTGQQKGEPISAFLFGVFLGPFGIMLAALSSGYKVPCAHCREPMHRQATICPHCHLAPPPPEPADIPDGEVAQEMWRIMRR
jgi:hypothetical protein